MLSSSAAALTFVIDPPGERHLNSSPVDPTACREISLVPPFSFKAACTATSKTRSPARPKCKKVLKARKHPVWKKLLSEIREKDIILWFGQETLMQHCSVLGPVPGSARHGPMGTPHTVREEEWGWAPVGLAVISCVTFCPPFVRVSELEAWR